MNYEEFKNEVIKIYETEGNMFAHGKCRGLIPQIDLTEEEKKIIAAGPAAAGADVEYWKKWCANDYRESTFEKWMAALKDERKAAAARGEAKRKAEWDAKSPEEKAKIKNELEKMAEAGRKAKAEYLNKYYEDAARYGWYTGD